MDVENPLTYEIMTPQSSTFRIRRLVLGSNSGRHALALRCEQLGHQFDRRELDEVYRKFVVCGPIKKVQDSHLLELIQEFALTAREFLRRLRRFLSRGQHRSGWSHEAPLERFHASAQYGPGVYR